MKLELIDFDIVIDLIDFAHLKKYDVIVTDLKIDPIILKLKFNEYREIYKRNEQNFQFKINDELFSGRFGKIIYDKDGNIRLFFDILEKLPERSEHKNIPVTLENVAFYNLKKLVTSQQKIINILVDTLDKNNLISDSLRPELDILQAKTKNDDINREVTNLYKYLEYTGNSIDYYRTLDE